MHVRTPFWYRLMSNEIMEHTAHHLQPKIPLYNLKTAQAELHRRTGGHIPQVSAAVSAIRDTLQACKLYDYGRRCWLDFDGRPSSGALGPE